MASCGLVTGTALRMKLVLMYLSQCRINSVSRDEVQEDPNWTEPGAIEPGA